MTKARASKADYGVDAPVIVLRFVIIALVAMIFAVIGPYIVGTRERAIQIASIGRSTAIWCSMCAAALVWGSRVGKLRLRDRLLADLALRGDEQVLDVGCGRGLLLLGAARALPKGRAFGVDLWPAKDRSGNTQDATRENARIEGVEDRIELKTGDMRKLPYPVRRFDVVLSSWAIHHLPDPADRRKALQEMVRVLKPGGRIRILETQHTADLEAGLREAGLIDVVRSGSSFFSVIPTRCVAGRKPLA